MILPIVAYGDPVLRKKAGDITKDYPGLAQLIANMFETMNNAKGVGLAAPQVGVSIRLFIIDGAPYVVSDDDDDEEEDEEDLKNFKKIFINAEIIKEEGEKWKFNEGCLSIPNIREDVERQPELRIRYVDENFVKHEETYTGIKARIIQHEYDHIDGILFTDRINPLRKRLLKRKLTDISKGLVDVKYKMKFPVKK
jgi:peptide deformylase